MFQTSISQLSVTSPNGKLIHELKTNKQEQGNCIM